MNEFLKRTWAQINLDHLRENVTVIQNRLQLHTSTQMMAIVKADAYGHGDAFVARELQDMGICWFGVSNLEEALSLRRAGIAGEILILGMTPAQHGKDLAEYGITQAVFSPEYARELDAAAVTSGVQVKVHIKLDTGISTDVPQFDPPSAKQRGHHGLPRPFVRSGPAWNYSVWNCAFG